MSASVSSLLQYYKSGSLQKENKNQSNVSIIMKSLVFIDLLQRLFFFVYEFRSSAAGSALQTYYTVYF
jgi:hypothetical protein